MQRAYLDYNATTPLRREASDAMIAAMDVTGNPSSVHTEGRAAKALLERARAQVAQLVGCTPQQVIFTSGSTEAAALAVVQKDRHGGVFAALPTEHDCFLDWSETRLPALVDEAGASSATGWAAFQNWLASHKSDDGAAALIAISAANSETGLVWPGGKLPGNIRGSDEGAGAETYDVVCDLTQAAGKIPLTFGVTKPSYAVLSAHKLGGPKGVGALINFTSQDPQPILRGGGQEMGRRSGTENLVGIAGFGAAAEAAGRDVAAGRWEEIKELRKILENALAAATKTTIFVGKGQERLPNTLCFATPAWKGEAQVIQMDLAGFAISAGSACSSGKVRASNVLTSMGYDEKTASCAVRVSMGLETTKEQVERFAQSWLAKEAKFQARAA